MNISTSQPNAPGTVVITMETRHTFRSVSYNKNIFLYKYIFKDSTTLERYEGGELAGKTIKSKKNYHTFYFLSNSKDVEDDHHKYGFSCSYKFF